VPFRAANRRDVRGGSPSGGRDLHVIVVVVPVLRQIRIEFPRCTRPCSFLPGSEAADAARNPDIASSRPWRYLSRSRSRPAGRLVEKLRRFAGFRFSHPNRPVACGAPVGIKIGPVGFSRKAVALVHGHVHLCNERGQKADPSDDGQNLSLEQVRSAHSPSSGCSPAAAGLTPAGANEIDLSFARVLLRSLLVLFR
jgi:hypothetical protein